MSYMVSFCLFVAPTCNTWCQILWSIYRFALYVQQFLTKHYVFFFIFQTFQREFLKTQSIFFSKVKRQIESSLRLKFSVNGVDKSIYPIVVTKRRTTSISKTNSQDLSFSILNNGSTDEKFVDGNKMRIVLKIVAVVFHRSFIQTYLKFTNIYICIYIYKDIKRERDFDRVLNSYINSTRRHPAPRI